MSYDLQKRCELCKKVATAANLGDGTLCAACIKEHLRELLRERDKRIAAAPMSKTPIGTSHRKPGK